RASGMHESFRASLSALNPVVGKRRWVAPGLLVHGECLTRYGGRLKRDATRVRYQVPSFGRRAAAGGNPGRRFAAELTRTSASTYLFRGIFACPLTIERRG